MLTVQPSGERWVVSMCASACGAMVAFVGLRGLSLPAPVAAIVVAALGVVGTVLLVRRLPAGLDGLRRRCPWRSVAWLLLVLLALGQTARMSTFLLDPTRTACSLVPSDPWYLEHSCLTAYVESSRMAQESEPNIYAPERYVGRKLAGFNVDLYHYPPPFLLLPTAAEVLTGHDYLKTRALWFSLSALTFLLAIGFLAARFDDPGRLRAIATGPVLWLSVPVQMGLQMSNVQILIVSVSVLAWVAFARQKALGGALLALAIASKIFPGFLGIYLLARRRWREAIWTTVFGGVLTVLALASFGAAPFVAFLGFELPRLSSGEAFSRPLSRSFAVGQNMAPFGVPLKLAKVGVPGMTFAVGRAVSTVFMLGLVALALAAGRRKEARPPDEEASIWMAILCLGTLVSPFAPANYVLVTVVWLACLERRIRLSRLAAIWFFTSVPFLLPREGDFAIRTLAFLPAQVIAIGLPAWVLWRGARNRAVEA